MPQTATMIVVALVFASFAIWQDWPDDAARCPAKVEVIRYLYMIEPAPIYPAPQLMNVADYSAPVTEPEAVEPKAEEEVDASPSRRHRYRYRRHWRRGRR